MIPYTSDALAAIERAETVSRAKYPTDSRAQCAYLVGCLRGELKTLASRAQLDSQLDQITKRIASRAEVERDDATELLDAISAALQRRYPNDRSTIEDAFEDVVMALADVSDEVEFEEAA